MQVQDLAIADGQIESIQTSSANVEVFLTDWQERRWRLTFVDVLAIENLSVEGADLDQLEIHDHDPYIEHIRALLDAPNEEVKLYLFYTAWIDPPRLRVVARDCQVKAVEKPRHEGA